MTSEARNGGHFAKGKSLIYYLVYTSTATHAMTEQELLALLEQSRKDNEAANVTGMLLYKGGAFIQVLEGDEAVVSALYEKIHRDLRHHATELLLTGEQAKRSFSNWSMGFVNLSDLAADDLQGFSEFFNEGFNVDAMRQHPQRVFRMLLRFRDAG